MLRTRDYIGAAGVTAVCWTPAVQHATISEHNSSVTLFQRGSMIAVIGNVIAGLGVVSLFTATLRLTKPGK
jgi:hypothetical protein